MFWYVKLWTSFKAFAPPFKMKYGNLMEPAQGWNVFGLSWLTVPSPRFWKRKDGGREVEKYQALWQYYLYYCKRNRELMVQYIWISKINSTVNYSILYHHVFLVTTNQLAAVLWSSTDWTGTPVTGSINSITMLKQKHFHCKSAHYIYAISRGSNPCMCIPNIT